MRRKAHGERFSLRGERRSLLGEMQNSRGRQSSRGENPGSRGKRKTCSEEPQARSEKDEAWAKNGETRARQGKITLGKAKSAREMRNSRAAGKAPPFEFLPLLSTCPLGGHATPWFTAPWISAPLASLFLDFFHPLNSCHLLVLHSFTPAYWVSDYPFFDSRHCRF